jgi:hypothetical protein
MLTPNPVQTATKSQRVRRWERGHGARTDDDVHVPARKTRVDEDAADFFLVAPRQFNVDVIGPFEPDTSAAVTAQHSPVPACVDDGETSQVLHEHQARCRESAEWCTNEERELEAPFWREPGVGSAAPPRELECGQGDDRGRKRRQETRIPVWWC